MVRGSGCHVVDADGNSYIDYVCSYGPLILGHSHPGVVRAIQEQASRGTSFGAPTRGEVELAEVICRCLPSVEMVRLVNSGTEALMSAVRLARAATGRRLLIKFAGGYHGHYDPLLTKAGSGYQTLGIVGTPGVSAEVASEVMVLPYNDVDGCRRAVGELGPELAAVVVEPVAANMGVVGPSPHFLPELRAMCTKSGALLIFDEVITGFRVALGGAQELFGVNPDITCLGKIIGGGLPVGAYGASRRLMDLVSPNGPVYQAGTLSGSPLAVAAGLATLHTLRSEPPYAELESKARFLETALSQRARDLGLPVTVNRVASLLSVFLCSGPVVNLEDVLRSDQARFASYFHRALSAGVYLAPSQAEAMFVSTAHSDDDLERSAEVLCEAMEFAFASKPS